MVTMGSSCVYSGHHVPPWLLSSQFTRPGEEMLESHVSFSWYIQGAWPFLSNEGEI